MNGRFPFAVLLAVVLIFFAAAAADFVVDPEHCITVWNARVGP
jgi:hypothetical protein